MTEKETTALIKISPELDLTVVALAEEARKLRDHATIRVIATDADLSPVTDDLSIIAKLRKVLSEKKAEYLKPIKAHIDAVNAAFATILAPLEEADLITRSKVKEYRDAAEKRRLEAEEINRQKQELARREAAFSGTGEVTVDTTPVEAPMPVYRVTTELGTASTMRVKKWELVDFKLVPDDFKTLDSAKITKLVKAGGTIAGIRVYEEESIRVTTR